MFYSCICHIVFLFISLLFKLIVNDCYFFYRSVPVLVRCGASVSAEDEEGRTPTFLALLNACTPAAAALLAFPQSLEQTTKVIYLVKMIFWSK